MEITYYLSGERERNLYCRISDGSEDVSSTSLGHTIDPKKWKKQTVIGSYDDPYHYTLINLKSYLNRQYLQLKNTNKKDILTKLKHEVDIVTEGSGIEGVARKIFNEENKKDGVYEYDQFIQAFEKYSDLNRSEFEAQVIENSMYFYTKEGEIFEMDTFEGLTSRLRDLVNRRFYDEIYTETEAHYWSEIYLDGGIEKHVFLPILLQEWEHYWNKKYEEIAKSVGNIDHFVELREKSWRELQVYMECYDNAGNSIELASDINDMVLYPLAVISMLSIFDEDTCYLEYCELAFENGEWESISLNEEDMESAILYIRPAQR